MTVNATWNTTEATTLTGEEVIAMDQQYVMRAWSKQGQAAMAVEKAEGIYFWDYEGNRQVDMSSLLVNANIGHQHPKVVKAIQDQAAKMCFMAPSYATDVKSLLAKKLVELAGGDMARVFFTNAGADANENAIKMARIATGRTKVIVMSSRPGRIVKVLDTDFTYVMDGANSESARYSKQYMTMRESILNVINQKDELAV